MKRSLVKNYAKLIARVGGNIQKGQEVFITAEIESSDFVRMLAEECYAAGASDVFVEWKYQKFDKLASRFESVRALSSVEPGEEAKLAYKAETFPVTIKILSADPDGMKGADREKLTLAQMARAAITKPYSDKMTNRHQWCVAAVPSVGWAKKVFPEERASAAVEKLWQLILHTSRADGKDPLTDWMWHNRELKEKCDTLNAYGSELEPGVPEPREVLKTFAGLSGMGDLIVTCTSMHSRNLHAGMLIGHGATAEEAKQEVGQVVEGINVLPAAKKLEKKYKVEMPIVNVVDAILSGRMDAKDAVDALMGRNLKKE